MKYSCSKVVWTLGLLGVSMVGLAGEAVEAVPGAALSLPAVPKHAPPQEPVGFVTGGLIGGFAAGPVGAIIGAGLGTWLGNRVHRAGEAAAAEAQVAALQSDKSQLQSDKSQLQTEKSLLLSDTSDLSESNRALTARLDQTSHTVDAAQSAQDDSARDEARDEARDDAARILDGLQGDVLFRTGSADITPEMAHGVQVLAQAVAKSSALKVRVDGYSDARGTVESNLKLSEARANAVGDLFRAAGVTDEALEINAYGKSQSVAEDNDGYALERRVRLTLQAESPAAVAQAGGLPSGGSGETAEVSENE